MRYVETKEDPLHLHTVPAEIYYEEEYPKDEGLAKDKTQSLMMMGANMGACLMLLQGKDPYDQYLVITVGKTIISETV